MASLSWKWRILALFVSLGVLVSCILALFLVHVDQYTNMSVAQEDAQEERYLSAQVAACQQAGGNPQADGTTMYCNVAFQPPNTSWYVTPVSNPNYELWEILQPLLGVLAGTFTIVVGWLLLMLFLYYRTGRQGVTAYSGR